MSARCPACGRENAADAAPAVQTCWPGLARAYMPLRVCFERIGARPYLRWLDELETYTAAEPVRARS